jgi:FMN reductase
MADLLGLVGTVSEPSKTRVAVETAVNAARQAYDIETEIAHLADYDLQTADGRSLDEYTGDTAELLDTIIASDAFIIGTPVYRASYSGVLKNLFDIIPRGMWQADVAPLENSAVGLIATGATAHHYLTVEKELLPILAFFGAHLVGSGAYLSGDCFDDYTLVDEDVRRRLSRLGEATIDLSRAIEASDALSSLGPQF